VTESWTEYAVIESDGEVDLVTRDLTYALSYAEPSTGDVVRQRTVTRTVTEWADVSCRYVTSLDKPCGRSTINTGYCVLHDVLSRLDRMNLRELAETTWTPNPVLDQVRLTIAKHLAPKDAFRWTDNPVIWSDASLRRHEALRIMRGELGNES
jgi:hypothetical protein